MHETKRSYKSYFRKFFICFDFFKYVSHVSSLYESINHIETLLPKMCKKNPKLAHK